MQTVHYIFGRYEILRTTFHRIDNDYCLRIEDATAKRYQLLYDDMLDFAGDKETYINKLVNYVNNDFDFLQVRCF
ncbi:hypothetical protein INP83_12130 [Mucilaginibacter sp. 21P]|uniref:hypothetical protein n=1 Tax=Mucilaginibacter sp. 21P TaxID=2778902 RepID=UPI001C55F7D8|nr:hypothetical protein [Mucilaginibacter sp. 21P]QXV63853.1 hypothetical protein INP83_12130 [Mucilaginibacter sp. 21P]